MMRFLFAKRPFRERLIAVGGTFVALSLIGPLLASLVGQRTIETSSGAAIPFLLVGSFAVVLGLGLAMREGRRTDR